MDAVREHTLGELFTAQEIAERLGDAERSVRRWIASGQLPAKKIGRSFAIRLDQAEEVAGLAARKRAAAREEERDREAALAELRGRYQELKETVDRLHHELAEERRRAARLEVELEMRAA